MLEAGSSQDSLVIMAMFGLVIFAIGLGLLSKSSRP